MNKTVSVLITSKENKSEQLKHLLHSLVVQDIRYLRIYLILDRKNDLLINDIQKILKPVEFFFNDNHCITYIQNKIMKNLNSELILLLNDDIILENYFISSLTDSIDKNEKIGICCGKIKRMDKITIDSAGQFLARSRKPLDRGYGQKDKGQFDSAEYIFGACGAAVLYRKKMLESIQITPGEYFDNDYHLFYEDLDIAWRAQNLGWKVFYDPKAVCYHVRGATVKQNKPKFSFLNNFNFAWLPNSLKVDVIKNRYMTIIKNDKLSNFLINLPFILFYDLKVFIYCLFFCPIVIKNCLNKVPLIMNAWKKRKYYYLKYEKIRQKEC
ncbi:MAG: glycosyltransferase [Candidatus Omnitrophota bacterium]